MGLPGSEDSLTIYVEPFRHNTSVWRTDRETDRQTCAVWLRLTHV